MTFKPSSSPVAKFSSRELAVHCARLVDEKGGEGVRVLQMPAAGTEFAFAVLVTANSDRLTNALVEEIWHFCKRHGVDRMPVEGESGWMLIDCYEVIVHALSTDKREFYDLDTLWPMAREVQWAKEAKVLGDPDKPVKPTKIDKPAKAGKAGKAHVETAEEPEPEEDIVEKPKRRKVAPHKKAISASDAAQAATAVIPEAKSAVKPKRRKPVASKKR